MKIMERYKSGFWYLLCNGSTPVLDEYGSEIGAKVLYGEAVPMRANVSPAVGTAQVEQFGSSVDYDKVILTDETDCPMDENTVLFLDKKPEYGADGAPLYDYRVKRVAKSKNFVSYAVGRASVS